LTIDNFIAKIYNVLCYVKECANTDVSVLAVAHKNID